MGLFSNLRAMVIGNPVTGDSYLLLDIPKILRRRWHWTSSPIGPISR